MSLVCVPQLALAAFVPAIPQIGAHFGAGESDLSRSMVGYMAAYAISMLVTGQLADRYGAKRTQLAGLALFAGASALCLLAPNVAVFIAGRYSRPWAPARARSSPGSGCRRTCRNGNGSMCSPRSRQ